MPRMQIEVGIGPGFRQIAIRPPLSNEQEALLRFEGCIQDGMSVETIHRRGRVPFSQLSIGNEGFIYAAANKRIQDTAREITRVLGVGGTNYMYDETLRLVNHNYAFFDKKL